MSRALLQAWEKTVRRRADARAVVQAADGLTATFRELDDRAAGWLSECGVDSSRLKGRPVVFSAPNGIGWLVQLIGLLKAGAVVAPLDAAEPPAEQRRIARAIRAGFWWNGTKLEALAGAKRFRDPALCVMKLTSGTTGLPRALVFTAEQMLADARQVTTSMGIRTRDLNYALIPMGHSYGLGNLTIPLLGHGVPLVCGSAPLPHAIAADFARWRPTVFPGVPAMWRVLAASDLELPSLRLGISAGAPLPPEVARDFSARFGRRLHNFYGSSETGGIAYDRTGRGALGGNVGHAMRGVKLQGLNGDQLLVSSAAVVTHRNHRRVGRWGAWLMPDRAVLNVRGGVTLQGRRGRTVKVAGRRVNLAEIAGRLRRLPRVRDVWVGMTKGAEPALGAVVASDQTAVELRAALQADTASWKIPKKFVVVAALPVTARGKINSRALQTMLG